MRHAQVLAAAAIVVAAFSVGWLGVRTCREPVDVSGTIGKSAAMDAVKSYDVVWYPSHVALGTVLNAAGCSPLAAGLQWLKAGAHADTKPEVEMVGRGLSAARKRANQPASFDARLCRYVAGGFVRPQQQTAARLAGIDCT